MNTLYNSPGIPPHADMLEFQLVLLISGLSRNRCCRNNRRSSAALRRRELAATIRLNRDRASDPRRRASKFGRPQQMGESESPKDVPGAKRIAVTLCRAAPGEGDVDIDVLDHTMIELVGVIESGMPRRNGQREPRTSRGVTRGSRTAKALRV
jgi:hypothetical protein